MGADIFLKKDLQNRFATKGYCTFKLLDSKEIDELLKLSSFFAEDHDAGKSGSKFHGTGWIQNQEKRLEINNRLLPIIDKAAARFFKDYKIIGSGFLQKEFGEDSDVQLHQDWTYVDEKTFFSMNLWVALENIAVANGAMYVIPYSHRVFSGYLRPSPNYPVPFKDIKPFLSIFKVPIVLQKGECICFNNALLHGSFPNLKDSKRLAVVATILPHSATLVHHYSFKQTLPEEVTEFAISNESFLKIERGLPPENYISKNPKQTRYPNFGRVKFLLRFCKIIASDILGLP